jgi:TRAP-type C4-dicarboxylate transport system permease small subunit
MSKDQAIGGAIFAVCIIVAIVYIVALFGYEQLIQPWLNIGSFDAVRYWLIAVPVLVAFVAILFIGAWIGWTMATEIEEKKEEMKTEESSEAETSETPKKKS